MLADVGLEWGVGEDVVDYLSVGGEGEDGFLAFLFVVLVDEVLNGLEETVGEFVGGKAVGNHND